MKQFAQYLLEVYPLLIALPVAVILGIYLTRKQNQHNTQRCEARHEVLPDFIERGIVRIAIVCVLSCVAIWGPICPVAHQSVAIRNGLAVAAFPNLSFPWRWDSRVKGASIESYARTEVQEKFNSSPLTLNPSVRALVCVVELGMAGTPEAYMQFRGTDWQNNTNARLRYLLYEFEGPRHGELKDFYNPEDKEQQKRFQAIIYDFLAPHINGRGVYLKSAYFRRPLHD